MFKEYKYGMRLRGFSLGCQPMQGLIRKENAHGAKYHDILVYSRKLTDKEMNDYDLDYIGGRSLGDVMKAKELEVHGKRWYYQEFTDALGDTESLNLYDEDGDLVCEFESWSDMMWFIQSPVKMSETCQ